MTDRQPFHIVVAEPYDPAAVARLEALGTVRVLADSAPQTLLAAVSEADALLVRSKAHVTARIIESAPRLKVIARAATNVDHIDLRAARQRGIHVVFAPRIATKSRAEFTMALILALHRRIPFFDRRFRQGEFEALRTPTGYELRNLTLGLLGTDDVADELARMMSAAFGLRIIHHDLWERTSAGPVGEAVELDVLLREADIISIHLRQTPQTRGLVGEGLLARMKATALLVNASRGPVVDTIALARVLKKRQIGGAALDVFDSEPLPADHPLRSAPNCILTPHVAGFTLDAAAERFAVTEDVIRVLSGKPPRFPADLVED